MKIMKVSGKIIINHESQWEFQWENHGNSHLFMEVSCKISKNHDGWENHQNSWKVNEFYRVMIDFKIIKTHTYSWKSLNAIGELCWLWSFWSILHESYKVWIDFFHILIDVGQFWSNFDRAVIDLNCFMFCCCFLFLNDDMKVVIGVLIWKQTCNI